MVLGLSAVMVLGGCSKKSDAESDKNTTGTETESGTKKEDIVASDYITLGQYMGIEVEKVDTTVTDDDVQAEIDELLLQHATEEYVENRPVQDGDVVDIDFKGYLGDKEFEGGSAEGYRLTIGSDSFIDGFEDGIIGANVGDKLDLNLTFPADYGNEELAGKDVLFKVTVNKIVLTIPAVLTDAFVAENTDYETIDAYKEGLKAELLEENIASAESTFTNSVWTKIIENVEVKEYPESMVEDYKSSMNDYYQQYATYMGYSLDEFIESNGLTKEEYDDMILEMAQSNTKEELTFMAIIAAEKIELTDEEFQNKCEEYKSEYEFDTVEELLEYYGEDTVRQSILWQKTLDYLTENAVEI